MRPWLRDALRTLAAGAVIGLIVLGLGGRLAMAAIQLQTTGDSNWSFGGSMTVVFLGGVSGLAGAAMFIVSQWAARRVGAPTWGGYLLLALLLLLVTMRGLRGAAPAGAFYFYPLVALYGALLVTASRLVPARLTARQ
jgi:hypothetical protein